MAGIVMVDLMGGDYMYAIVDDKRWEQIAALRAEDMPGYDTSKKNDAWRQVAMYLASDDNSSPPPGAPKRVGRVYQTLWTQSGVIEPVDYEGPIIGFLSIRCS